MTTYEASASTTQPAWIQLMIGPFEEGMSEPGTNHYAISAVIYEDNQLYMVAWGTDTGGSWVITYTIVEYFYTDAEADEWILQHRPTAYMDISTEAEGPDEDDMYIATWRPYVKIDGEIVKDFSVDMLLPWTEDPPSPATHPYFGYDSPLDPDSGLVYLYHKSADEYPPPVVGDNHVQHPIESVSIALVSGDPNYHGDGQVRYPFEDRTRSRLVTDA